MPDLFPCYFAAGWAVVAVTMMLIQLPSLMMMHKKSREHAMRLTFPSAHGLHRAVRPFEHSIKRHVLSSRPQASVTHAPPSVPMPVKTYDLPTLRPFPPVFAQGRPEQGRDLRQRPGEQYIIQLAAATTLSPSTPPLSDLP